MSDIVIALLLLVPIAIVIFILNNANKRRKKKVQKRINAFITDATRQTGITNYYRKQLVHQTVIIDERNSKLLLVEHNGIFSFNVYPLEAVKNVLVLNETKSFAPAGKGQKQENLTTRIGVEITFGKNVEEKFITLYDYLEHNIYMMRDFEKEAHELRDKIERAGNGNQ
jgi:hypothetical protein